NTPKPCPWLLVTDCGPPPGKIKPLWSKESCVGLKSKVTPMVQVSGVLLIEAANNPRPVHKLCHQTQHPKQDHYFEFPRARPELQPSPSTRRNRLSKNRKKNNSAARL